MNLEWQLGQSEVPCMVCSAQPWLFLRQRELSGAEALALQGFPVADLKHQDNRFKNRDLLHMAGNAMSGFVLVPLFISIFAHMDCDCRNGQWIFLELPTPPMMGNQESEPVSVECSSESEGTEEESSESSTLDSL